MNDTMMCVNLSKKEHSFIQTSFKIHLPKENKKTYLSEQKRDLISYLIYDYCVKYCVFLKNQECLSQLRFSKKKSYFKKYFL